MYATNLATIARSAGLRVVEVKGWKTRGHGELDAVRTIVCHHTAGPRNGQSMPSLGVVTNGRADLSGPLCNLALGRDGTVYTVAAGLAYHAGQVRSATPPFSNAFSLGIEAENDGTGEPWPTVQLDAYALLCAALAHAYGLPVGRILGHKEVCAPPGRKIDPYGFEMDALRRAVEVDIVRLAKPVPSSPITGELAPRSGTVGRPLKAPAFPLAAGSYFGPARPLWNLRSVSGLYSHRGELKPWQQRMRTRGWDVGVTGVFDAKTAKVAAAFRAEKKLGKPGEGARVDATTWRAAWLLPVTR
jgi:hypothetical protein